MPLSTPTYTHQKTATITLAKVLNKPLPQTTYLPKIQIRLILLRPLTHELPLFYLSKEIRYYLPSGRLQESDTSDLPALERLALEETRCEIDITNMEEALVGIVEEYRGGVHLIAYCYYGIVSKEDVGRHEEEKGGKGGEKMEEDGKELEGLEWFTLQEAVELLSAIKPKTEKGRRIQEGDLFLIERLMEKLGLEKAKSDVEVEVEWSEMDDIL